MGFEFVRYLRVREFLIFLLPPLQCLDCRLVPHSSLDITNFSINALFCSGIQARMAECTEEFLLFNE